MSIVYPVSRPAASAVSSLSSSFKYNYAIGRLEYEGGSNLELFVGTQYTASFNSDHSSYMIFTSDNSGVIDIYMPIYTASNTFQSQTPLAGALEFWRLDNHSASIRLTSTTSSVLFGTPENFGPIDFSGSSDTYLLLPPSSYTSIVQIPVGDPPGNILYLVLEQSPLAVSPNSIQSGSFTNANIIVDSFGRVVSASNGTGGGGGGGGLPSGDISKYSVITSSYPTPQYLNTPFTGASDAYVKIKSQDARKDIWLTPADSTDINGFDTQTAIGIKGINSPYSNTDTLKGGYVNIFGGDGSKASLGGHINISAGKGGDSLLAEAGGNGGDINIQGGDKGTGGSGNGNYGRVYIGVQSTSDIQIGSDANSSFTQIFGGFSAPVDGDITGSSSNAKVIKIQNRDIYDVITPVSGNALIYDGSKWVYENTGGDLSGSITDAKVIKIQNREIYDTVAPVSGNALIYDGSKWVYDNVSGGGGGVSSVSAVAPLSSSGGSTPTLHLSGVITASNGGTGLSSSGLDDTKYLKSDGAGGWMLEAPAGITEAGIIKLATYDITMQMILTAAVTSSNAPEFGYPTILTGSNVRIIAMTTAFVSSSFDSTSGTFYTLNINAFDPPKWTPPYGTFVSNNISAFSVGSGSSNIAYSGYAGNWNSPYIGFSGIYNDFSPIDFNNISDNGCVIHIEFAYTKV